MAATTLSALSFSRPHAKKMTRMEELEKMPIGKMDSLTAIGYLLWRHARVILTIAFFATNLYWIVRFYHQ